MERITRNTGSILQEVLVEPGPTPQLLDSRPAAAGSQMSLLENISQWHIDWLKYRTQNWEQRLRLSDVEAFNEYFSLSLTVKDLHSLLWKAGWPMLTQEQAMFLFGVTRNMVFYPIDPWLVRGFNARYGTDHTTSSLRVMIEERDSIMDACSHLLGMRPKGSQGTWRLFRGCIIVDKDDPRANVAYRRYQR